MSQYHPNSGPLNPLGVLTLPNLFPLHLSCGPAPLNRRGVPAPRDSASIFGSLHPLGVHSSLNPAPPRICALLLPPILHSCTLLGGPCTPATLHPCTPRPCTSWGLCPPTPVCPIPQCKDAMGCPRLSWGAPTRGQACLVYPIFPVPGEGGRFWQRELLPQPRARGRARAAPGRKTPPNHPKPQPSKHSPGPPQQHWGSCPTLSPQCRQWGQMKGGSGVQDPQIGWDPAPLVAPQRAVMGGESEVRCV